MADTVGTDVLGLTVQIVAACVGRNEVKADTLPVLIQSVHQSLAKVETPQAEPAAAQAPAVPVKRSVFPDFLCLEGGKKLKMLKRHLKTSDTMTPANYREKWKLSNDYPMATPSYASHRSSLAKSIGLGRRGNSAFSEPAVTQVPARHARGSKA